MARRYHLFKFYVSPDTHPGLVRLLEGMPPYQRNAFIKEAIEQYEKRSEALRRDDVVALTGIMEV